MASNWTREQKDMSVRMYLKKVSISGALEANRPESLARILKAANLPEHVGTNSLRAVLAQENVYVPTGSIRHTSGLLSKQEAVTILQKVATNQGVTLSNALTSAPRTDLNVLVKLLSET